LIQKINTELIRLDKDKIDKRYFYRFFKRLFDLLASGTALIILSPFFLIISLLIYINDQGPIFYSQIRIGREVNHLKCINLGQWLQMPMNFLKI